MKGRRRQKKGFILIAVLVISLFAIMFLLAAGASLVSFLRSEGAVRNKSDLLDAALSVRDYMIQSMNDSPQVTQQMILSDTIDQLVPSEVPYDELGINGITVSISLRNLSESEMDELAAKDSTDPSQRALLENSAVLRVTALKGVFGSTIESVITPYALGVESAEDLQENNVPTQPLFVSSSGVAMSGLATDSLSISPRTGNGSLVVENWSESELVSDNVNSQTIDSSNGKTFRLDLHSNTSTSVNGKTVVLGNIDVANGQGGNIAKVGADSWILGRVETNSGSNNSVAATAGPNPALTDNVWALADWASSYQGTSLPSKELLAGETRRSPNDMPANFNATLNQLVPNPVPMAPVKSASLSTAITDSDGGDFSHPVINGEEFSSFRGTTLNTAASDFSPITISNNSEASRIYIDNGDSTEPITINTDKFANKTIDPRNLQLFYGGTGKVAINIRNNDFNGLIYAPFANLDIRGEGDFNGAFVAKNVTVNVDGVLRLMSASDLTNSGAGSSTLVPQILGSSSTATDPYALKMSGYKAASYREL